MAKAKSLVGLDVHAAKIVAAVLDADSGELQTFSMSGEDVTAAAFCAGLPRPVCAAYEAGPTGYGLARELAKRGVECVVAAPSKIPRASGDRVKTDRRDAEHLVRLLLAGKLHAVRVPGPEAEALRDLVRARDAVRMDLMRCRHRLSKLLLRHGIRCSQDPPRDARVRFPKPRVGMAVLLVVHPHGHARLDTSLTEASSVRLAGSPALKRKPERRDRVSDHAAARCGEPEERADTVGRDGRRPSATANANRDRRQRRADTRRSSRAGLRSFRSVSSRMPARSSWPGRAIERWSSRQSAVTSST